ncbi:transporter, cation channel family protein, partial [Teladorsagia circumcincta]
MFLCNVLILNHQVIANGCVLGRGAYFKDGWNILDGILVIISLVNVLFELFATGDSPKIFGVIRVLRLLRALRPLRVINRAPGVKLVVMTLISSDQVFFGCVTFSAQFRVAAGLENDSDDMIQDPIENYNEWRMIYFISFLLLVGFFVLNMFVGVVVENFHKCKEALEKEMREKAREKRLQRKLKRQKYEESVAGRKKKVKKNQPYWHNYGTTRMFLNGVVTSKYFDLAIAAVIGINVISMAMEFYMMPPGLKYVLKALNYFFTAVFTLEAAMKLAALGIRRFFSETWNRLDMFIVFLSVAGIIFEEFEALELPINPTIIRVMRVLRIARVLKLLKMAKGIRSLLDTVGEALPQVGNLGSLFFLLFFIFAALGVELFGKLECSEDHPCDGLGEHAHFKNFGMAFLTLFRIATGDNWNGIMKDALRDDCDSSERCETNCCVDPILAPCFFVIFVLISQFVLVNVVVAVLMKHLEESNKRDAETNENQDGGTGNDPAKDTDIDEGNAEKEISINTLEQELIEVEHRIEEEIRRRESVGCHGHLEAELQPLYVNSDTYREDDGDYDENLSVERSAKEFANSSNADLTMQSFQPIAHRHIDRHDITESGGRNNHQKLRPTQASRLNYVHYLHT